jgi:hypothetical protein
MSHAILSNKLRLFISAQTAGLLLAAALGSSCMNASAQQPTGARQPMAFAPERTLADLEKAFWTCDYTATVYGILDAGMGVECGIATEDLKQKKFNGNFNAMLSWWQQNKAAQHGALDTAYRAAFHP